MVCLLAQLQFHYGYGGLAVGRQALVNVRVKNATEFAGPQARFAAPPGIRIETPPVWIPSLREVVWRIAAEQPGDYELTVQIGEDVFTKTVRVSERDRPALAPSRGWETRQSTPLPCRAAVAG